MAHARFESSVSLEALLAASDAPTHDEGARSLLLFECGGAVYGVDATAVEAIDEAGVIAPLPYPLATVAGVASVRGSMRLVVRLGKESSGRGRLVALSSDRNVAMYADRILGVVTVRRTSDESESTTDAWPIRLDIDGMDVALIDATSLIEP